MGKNSITSMRGGNSDAKSEYIYIEKFVNTEVLLDNYPLTNKGYINISGKKYAADTEVYLGRTNGENMVLKYSPLSFCMIPLKNILGTLYPDTKNTVNSGFFAYLGIGVELSSGEFKFTNHIFKLYRFDSKWIERNIPGNAIAWSCDRVKNR